jgi:hypothetical protein
MDNYSNYWMYRISWFGDTGNESTDWYETADQAWRNLDPFKCKFSLPRLEQQQFSSRN